MRKKIKRNKNLIIAGISLAVGVSLTLYRSIIGEWSVYLAGFLFLAGGILLVEGLLGLMGGKNLVGEEIFRNFKELVNSAKRRVVCISGSLDSEAYTREEIINAIKEGIKKGVDFLIISGEGKMGIDKTTLQRFWDEGFFKQPNFNLYLVEENPQPHGMYIDDRLLRIEAPHRPKEKVRSNTLFKEAALVNIVFDKTVKFYQQRGKKLTKEKLAEMDIKVNTHTQKAP